MDHDEALFELQRTLYTSKNPTRRWLHVYRRDWINAAIRRHGSMHRALEVGPGSGVYLPVLAEVAKEVVATDIEDAYLDRLQPLCEVYPSLRLQRDDITHSNLPDGHFGLILCTEVIEHIRDSPRALAEMRRLLEPDGTLLLSTPQRYSPLEIFSKIAFLPGVIDLVRMIYREPVLETGHINLMTSATLRSQLAQAGFAIRESYAAGVYIPVVAELLGGTALRIEMALDRWLRGSRLQWLLWTQYVVASPV